MNKKEAIAKYGEKVVQKACALCEKADGRVLFIDDVHGENDIPLEETDPKVIVPLLNLAFAFDSLYFGGSHIEDIVDTTVTEGITSGVENNYRVDWIGKPSVKPWERLVLDEHRYMTDYRTEWSIRLVGEIISTSFAATFDDGDHLVLTVQLPGKNYKRVELSRADFTFLYEKMRGNLQKPNEFRIGEGQALTRWIRHRKVKIRLQKRIALDPKSIPDTWIHAEFFDLIEA